MRCCQGNLLAAEVDALVNAVNTVGVMGKGIALAFKNRFPTNFQTYAAACQRRGRFRRPGHDGASLRATRLIGRKV